MKLANNYDKAYGFIERLGDIFDACSFIQEAGGCDRCPLAHNCLDSTSVAEFADTCTEPTIKEMLDFADDIEEYGNGQAYMADMEDRARRTEWELANEWAR